MTAKHKRDGLGPFNIKQYRSKPITLRQQGSTDIVAETGRETERKKDKERERKRGRKRERERERQRERYRKK